MRSVGTLKSWHDDRGFGFIAPADGSRDVFLHVADFRGQSGGQRPLVGETLFYDLTTDARGRTRATGASRTWAAPATAHGGGEHARRLPAPQAFHPRSATPPARRHPLLALAMAAALGALAYGLLHRSDRASPAFAAPPALTAPALSQPPPAFRCDGRTRCEEMRSCEEATFFLEHCPGVSMDGDHDGRACEQQWCNYKPSIDSP